MGDNQNISKKNRQTYIFCGIAIGTCSLGKNNHKVTLSYSTDEFQSSQVQIWQSYWFWRLTWAASHAIRYSQVKLNFRQGSFKAILGELAGSAITSSTWHHSCDHCATVIDVFEPYISPSIIDQLPAIHSVLICFIHSARACICVTCTPSVIELSNCISFSPSMMSTNVHLKASGFKLF